MSSPLPAYRSIWPDEYDDGTIWIIDQRHLPHELVEEPLRSSEAAARALGRSRVAAMALQAQGHGALIETLENNTGGPRIRAAFVLGGIGADARPALCRDHAGIRFEAGGFRLQRRLGAS